MKSRIVKSETLIDKSVVIIVKGTAGTEWLCGVPDRPVRDGGKSYFIIPPNPPYYSCYILPGHQHSEPEILVSYSTLEECETAFVETLENDLKAVTKWDRAYPRTR